MTKFDRLPAFGSISVKSALAPVLFALATAGMPVMATGQTAELPAQTSQAPAASLPTGLAAAVKAALPASDEARIFYSARGFEPVWVSDEGATPAADAYLAVLVEATRHALPAGRYQREDLKARAAQAATLGMADQAALEIALTRSYLTYARDISSGVLEPRKIDRELYVYPERRGAHALLTGVADATDPGKWFETLHPQSADYARLVNRYRMFRSLAETGGWGPKLTRKRTLRPGERSGDVTALRERLTAMGYLEVESAATDGVVLAVAETVTDAPSEPIGDPSVYDDQLVEAVRLFQARHGLNQDGAVGPATRAALNVDPGFRAAQIAVNLERMRWLNKDLGDKHVMVNLASFDMAVIENGQSVFTSRVVVGKSRKHRTPEMSDEMEHIVVNPTWHVPSSIARKEILPALQNDPDYLSRKGMRITGVDDPSLIDWSTVTPSTFPGRVKQRPGSGNALGRVKFMFPNDHAIYLHDTPSKSLFNRDTRAYSHGCVRVQKPFEFAEYLLSAQEEDAKGTFDRLLRSGRERYVNLDEHVPVHLTYRTAWVDGDGNDQFRGDIYGRDRKVLAALEKIGVDLPEH